MMVTKGSSIPYDNARLRRSLINSGICEQGLEAYISRANDAKIFYADSIVTTPDGKKECFPAEILLKKYLAPGETGPLQMWDRVSRAIAGVEIQEKQDFWYEQFMGILKDYAFVPGGRINHGAGREDVKRQPTLSNCYVIPITWAPLRDGLSEVSDEQALTVFKAKNNGVSYKSLVETLRAAGLPDKKIRALAAPPDSIEGIYQHITEAALVYRSGGGVGVDLSVLRPKGSQVNATIQKSPGPTGFMHLLSESTETIAQENRRGALMITLDVHHPDIKEFITIKNDLGRSKVKHANISVLVSDEFMQAVEQDTDYTVSWTNQNPLSTKYGEKFGEKQLRAREVWGMMIKNAHTSAEPGVIFWDRTKAYHNGEYATPLTSTNPCGEQPLASYTACNLGNINLLRFVQQNGSFDFNNFDRTTRISTRFLDDVITYNADSHALPEIKKAVSNDRRTGLGLTGLGSALVAMEIKYDSEQGLQIVEKIMQTMQKAAYETSIELAKERGSFPLFDWKGYSKSKFVQSLPEDLKENISQYGIRNVTVLTMPPVGTGSIITETSSGVEPIFATSYNRRVKQSGGELKEFKIYDALIKRLFGSDDNLPEHVRTAHQIDPFFRVKMQGIIQRYVDTSISSTINLPEDVSLETVSLIYREAYKQGLKGVTVYREGSREGVMETTNHAEKQETPINGKIHPRQRPAITHGVTIRTRTGNGNLYTTINEDDQGLCEVFNTVGKAGGEAAADTEAISRLISYIFRLGGDPRDIVKELKGISGPTATLQDGRWILSKPDAIGQALERYIFNKNSKDETLQIIQPIENGLEKAVKTEVKGAGTCPECGSGVKHETSCLTCDHCGWSKC
ncbi:MAG TPA: adenosylcobalamin-dependent ribonucleoside-diphosphate reductase [Candidatus Nanoarchaeia archaeon]|nr:adenosylcobalamin-dependent ribonucleoside-diphosphate reductase [Candidatus Nanoarchaeia archaeon]